MDGPAVARPRHTHTKKKVKGKKNQKIERLYRRTINRVSGHIQSARWARNQATVSCTIRLGLPILPSSIPSTLRLLNFPWAFGPFFFFILTSSEGKKEKKKGQYSLRLAVVRLRRWKSYYIDLFLQFEFYRENEEKGKSNGKEFWAWRHNRLQSVLPIFIYKTEQFEWHIVRSTAMIVFSSYTAAPLPDWLSRII